MAVFQPLVTQTLPMMRPEALADDDMRLTARRDALAVTVPDLERLAHWNATEVPFETGLRLGDLILRTVAQHQAAVAVRFEGRDVSYAELDSLAWAVALRLRDMGVRPGDLVGVCLERSIELVAALVGVVYSGGAYVPLDPAYPRERLAQMCEDARLRVVITCESEFVRAGAAFPDGVRIVRIGDSAA